MISKPLAVLVGSIGKLPYAGVSFYYLHYVHGLHELGYDVFYLENQNRPNEYYDPRASAMTDDLGYALGYLGDLLSTFDLAGSWTVVGLDGQAQGSGRRAMQEALDRADFVLTVADPTWLDDLGRCERLAFVDGDPLFTQAAMLSVDSRVADVTARYPILFTYAQRMGEPDCSVPPAGRRWIPTRPVVATSLWERARPAPGLPVTALLHWAAGSDVSLNGRTYGHKDRELERLIDLPRRANGRFVLAVGGKRAPRDRLVEHGWELVDPLASTVTLDAYREFIAGSRADLGIAKHAYVASRCGWFSDRSTCFLAAGRPVLHQNTGCGDWLPTGQGVLLFSDIDDLLEGIDELDRDYEFHARAARSLAEEHFEARTVVAEMLDAAGFR